MNARDILFYGNQTVLGTLAGVPEDAWETPGVCGHWSVRQIIAHLASYERVLVDLLAQFGRGDPEAFGNPYGPDFNDAEVARRDHLSAAETRAEYEGLAAEALELIAAISDERRRQPGLLPWYGDAYALDDYIVYAFYGHKREHSAQIAVFLDVLRDGRQSGR